MLKLRGKTLRCPEPCCKKPDLFPGARIRRADVAAHEHSRRDRNSSYWKKVRDAVPDLNKEETCLVSRLTVHDLPMEDHIQSVLDEKLSNFVKTSLFRAAPKDQPKRNLLLYGPPGSGKTHAVRAIAARLDLKMIILKHSDIHNKFVGESGKVLSAVVRLAWNHQPAILFIDECENLAGSRATGSADKYDAQVTSELLAVMNGDVTPQPGLMIICCTNLRHLIDSAALDRFQVQLEVPYPDAAMREVVWINTLKGADIALTPAQFEQLKLYPLPSLREIERVVTVWEELETDDNSQLLRIAQEMSAEPESDAELEKFPDDQRSWRDNASMIIADLLPARCVKTSKRIHMAIPRHIDDEWLQALVKGAEQVGVAADGNVNPFKLCLDETKGGCWSLQRAEHEDVRVELNITINNTGNTTINNMCEGSGGMKTEVTELKQQTAKLSQQVAKLSQQVDELLRKKKRKKRVGTKKKRQKRTKREPTERKCVDEEEENDENEESNDADLPATGRGDDDEEVQDEEQPVHPAVSVYEADDEDEFDEQNGVQLNGSRRVEEANGGAGDDDEEVVSGDEGDDKEGQDGRDADLSATGEDDGEEGGSNDEGDDEEDGGEQQPDVLDRMLEHIGLAGGRASREKVSYTSMRVVMQADEAFTAQETKQVYERYGIDLATWADGSVTLRKIKSQLGNILKMEGREFQRTQPREDGKKIEHWNLKHW
jgi:hypothetical protein